MNVFNQTILGYFEFMLACLIVFAIAFRILVFMDRRRRKKIKDKYGIEANEKRGLDRYKL